MDTIYIKLANDLLPGSGKIVEDKYNTSARQFLAVATCIKDLCS